MPFDLLGKILFPRQQRSERARNAKVLLGVLVTALVLGVCLGAVFYWQNSRLK